MGLDLSRVKADFPILSRTVNGKRLVYLDSASSSQKPAGGARRDGRAVPQLLRQHPPRRLHDRGRVHRQVRARARQDRTLPRRGAARTRSSSPRTSPRRSTSSRTRGAAPTSAKATPSSSPRWSTTPTSCRGTSSCAERGVELRWVPHRRRLPPRSDRARPAPRRRQALRLHRDVERARHRERRPRSSPMPPTPPARTVLVDAAQAVPHGSVDVQAWDADFVGLHRPQDARPERHRRLLGPPRAARGDAAVPRRRRDDPRRPQGRLRAQRGAVEVRGGHDAHRRGHRPRRRHRLPRSGRDGRGPRARTAAHRSTHCSAHARPLRRPHPRPRARAAPTIARRDHLVRVRRHPRPRHLAGARRRRHLRAREPPLRQAADARARRPRQHPSVVLRLQRRSGCRRPHRGLERAEKFFAI